MAAACGLATSRRTYDRSEVHRASARLHFQNRVGRTAAPQARAEWRRSLEHFPNRTFVVLEDLLRCDVSHRFLLKTCILDKLRPCLTSKSAISTFISKSMEKAKQPSR